MLINNYALKVYRIETERLVIRCYQPSDAGMLLSAIKNSIDNLKLWMPWAKDEPTGIEKKVKLLEKFKSDFESDKDYNFGIFNKNEDKLIGSSGLHTRIGENAREIGYWINTEFLNNGFATEATQALTKIGFDYQNIERIEIHCDPMNSISQKIPKRLGFTLVDVIKNDTVNAAGSNRDTMIWAISKDDYSVNKISNFNMKVFDQSGTELL